MGNVKEFVEKAVQTEMDAVPSPYADPAVVLAAPSVMRRAAQEAHIEHQNSIQMPSPTSSDRAYTIPQSTTSPMLAQTVSRRLSRRRHARRPGPVVEIVNRRIVSMPENKSEASSHSYTKRVVSMPDRVRPALQPPAELFQSPSTMAGDSLCSYSGRHDSVRVFRAPSDVPQTPSPPSSPESLLIIATGTQLPDGFLRRRYSPEPLVEEDEDWVTWANSPPRPIPALHGPLSLPYARCPSGAEGTIIEEPDSVAQMIWGLGPDDQFHNQVRLEDHISIPSNPQDAPSHGTGQAPLRLQKKRTSVTQQVPKSSRAPNTHTSHAKQSMSWLQRQAPDDKWNSLSQVSTEIETRQSFVSGSPSDEGQSIPIDIGVADNLVDDTEAFSLNNNRILEWQLARLRQALRTSLADMDSCTTYYPGRLEPVIPAAVSPGLPQSYPRIFVEPRSNDSAKQSPLEIAQQYRQQQLYWQALQKQKLHVQNLLPTPPNSSSPQWSSHFSPYLTYRSTLSPELVGSTEHPLPVSSQKYRLGMNVPQYLRQAYDQHEHDNVNDFDTSTNNSSAKTSEVMPSANVNSTPSLRPSSSSTLAKYIKQLQALSPIAQFSPLQPALPSTTPSRSLTSTDESTGPFRTIYRSPVVPTPPSPESPQTLSRGSHSNAHPMVPSRPVQRRLSSVPEEDSVLPELSTSLSPSRLQAQATTRTASGRDGHQICYANVTPSPVFSALPELESNLGLPSTGLHQEIFPVKVRLPGTKEHNVREQTSGHQERSKGHQHGHRRKHRFKKLKEPTANNEQETTR